MSTDIIHTTDQPVLKNTNQKSEESKENTALSIRGKIMQTLSKNPIPSSMVSKMLPSILTELNISEQSIIPNFLGTRNVAVFCKDVPLSEIKAIVVVHADKCAFVPLGKRLVTDFQLRGLEKSKGVQIIRGNGQRIKSTIEKTDQNIHLSNDAPKDLNPTDRVVFYEEMSEEGNFIQGSGLDNDCGIAIATNLIQEFQNNEPILFIFSDNEEGPAKNGRFSTGAKELNIALRNAGFDGSKTPVVILDGVDGEKEKADDDGQASIAWELSNGTRGVISQPMAERIQPHIEQSEATWYEGYTSGSDDWTMDFLMQYRIGVRGNGWHNHEATPPWANKHDLVKIHSFLQKFLTTSKE